MSYRPPLRSLRSATNVPDPPPADDHANERVRLGRPPIGGHVGVRTDRTDPAVRLSSLELRLPILEEGLDALLLVGRAEEEAAGDPVEAEPPFDVDGLIDGFLGEA